MITMHGKVEAFDFEDLSGGFKMMPGKKLTQKMATQMKMATSCHIIKLRSSVLNYSCEAKT